MKKIIIKNSRNREEELVLTLDEFKEKFKNELHDAIEEYTKDRERKNYLPSYLRTPPDYEQEFYFSLIFNFNNYAHTNYYIANIL